MATKKIPERVGFLSEGVRCAGWLYRPDAAGRMSPLVILGHGLGGTRPMRLDAFAERFVAEGWMVLIFDYRYLGASEGEPRQLLDIRKQLQDWHAALAYARSLPGVDLERVALWGSSFGGGHVMQVAAEDPRLAAVIAQCPFTDGYASLKARLQTGFLSALTLTAAGVVDKIGSWLGAPPLLLPMVGPAWLPAFLTAPDAISGMARLAPPGSQVARRTSRLLRRMPALERKLLPAMTLSEREVAPDQDSIWGAVLIPAGGRPFLNALAARLALEIGFYRPGQRLRQLNMPVLVCVCDHDSVAPAAATLGAAEKAPQAQVKRYPYGHFDIYVGAAFESVVADQIKFLQNCLS